MLCLICSGMNVLPAALSLSECAGLEPYRERLKGFMEGLDQHWTSAMDSTQQRLVLAVGITVQEQLGTPELCQVSAPTVELQQFRQEYWAPHPQASAQDLGFVPVE